MGSTCQESPPPGYCRTEVGKDSAVIKEHTLCADCIKCGGKSDIVNKLKYLNFVRQPPRLSVRVKDMV